MLHVSKRKTNIEVHLAQVRSTGFLYCQWDNGKWDCPLEEANHFLCREAVNMMVSQRAHCLFLSILLHIQT